MLVYDCCARQLISPLASNAGFRSSRFGGLCQSIVLSDHFGLDRERFHPGPENVGNARMARSQSSGCTDWVTCTTRLRTGWGGRDLRVMSARPLQVGVKPFGLDKI